MDEGAKLLDRVTALTEDIDLVGVAPLATLQGTPLAESAQALLPDARSVLVFGKELFDEVLRLVVPDKSMGKAAARDLYGPHSDYVNGRLTHALYQTSRVLRAEGYKALPLPASGTPVDGRFLRGIVSFKHAAEAAGLGRIGRSSLLITEAFGPRVRLALLLTTAELPSTAEAKADRCAGCGVCIERCPAGAITAPPPGQAYAINRAVCAQYGDASGGCSNCMSLCPAGAA
jgi:epoxyqueuosine reductase QueG